MFQNYTYFFVHLEIKKIFFALLIMKFYFIAQGASEFSGFKLDIWSSGITLYNFITGTYPFEGETIFRLFENIAKGDFDVPRNDVDQLLETLLRGMLASTPEDRLTLVQVREHDWSRKNHPCCAPPVTITPKGIHTDVTLRQYFFFWEIAT